MFTKPFVAACCLAAAAGPAFAQEVQPEQVAFRSGFADSEIRRFAVLARDIAAYRKQAMSAYFEAEDAEARRALIEAANARLGAMVAEAEGIDMADYDRINRLARLDPQLNGRIAAALKDLEAD